MLGNSPLRVLPSKTAIMPVNQELMPRSADEVERCSRTVYAANIDKKVDKNDVKAFFESLCGEECSPLGAQALLRGRGCGRLRHEHVLICMLSSAAWACGSGR